MPQNTTTTTHACNVTPATWAYMAINTFSEYNLTQKLKAKQVLLQPGARTSRQASTTSNNCVPFSNYHFSDCQKTIGYDQEERQQIAQRIIDYSMQAKDGYAMQWLHIIALDVCGKIQHNH